MGTVSLPSDNPCRGLLPGLPGCVERKMRTSPLRRAESLVVPVCPWLCAATATTVSSNTGMAFSLLAGHICCAAVTSRMSPPGLGGSRAKELMDTMSRGVAVVSVPCRDKRLGTGQPGTAHGPPISSRTGTVARSEPSPLLAVSSTGNRQEGV